MPDDDEQGAPKTGNSDHPSTTRSRIGRVLGHPFTLTVLAVVVGSVLIPAWIQRSQDRQAALEIKSDLVEQIAGSTTPAVRGAIDLVVENDAKKLRNASADLKRSYQRLKNEWLLNRALIRSKVSTYFPAIDECWYTYSDVVTSFISLPQPDRASKTDFNDLEKYVQDNDQGGCARVGRLVQSERGRFGDLRARIDWDSLHSQSNEGFRTSYASLGELLLIYKDGFTSTVNDSDPRGFRHGWWF
jgi:hypothetical protein